MSSLSQSLYTENFLHHQRLIRVELRSKSLTITDDFSTHHIPLNFDSYFTEEIDKYGNLTSLSVFSERVVHLAHNNPTVLQQWGQLLQKFIHKAGFHKDYSLIQVIGEGLSAKVFLAKSEKDGKKVIAKAFKRKKMDKKELLALQNQIRILRSINNQYFPKIYTTYQTQNSFYLIMEIASGITINQLIQKYSMSLFDKKKLLIQIATALNILHEFGIIHRDIKPQNIIYNPKTRKIKIIDFGFSVFLSQNAVYSHCGTPGYAAPQFFNNNNHVSIKSDIFAFGVLCHYILTGRLPYREGTKSILFEAKQCRFSISNSLKKYPSIYNLLKKMICHSSQRISLRYFLQSNILAQDQQSPNNPETKILHRKMENLSAINSRTQSRFGRQRGVSVKQTNQIKLINQGLGFCPYARLTTDRY